MGIHLAARTNKTTLGFLAGVVFGIFVAITPASLAGLGLKAWKGNPRYLQAGYISGFTDAVRIARARDPNSFVATTYPLPGRASTQDWQREINALYEDPKYADFPVSSLMAIAGGRLVTKFGTLQPSGASGIARLGEILTRRREARLKAEREEDRTASSKNGGVKSEPSPAVQAAASREQEDADRQRLAKSVGLDMLDWGELGGPAKRAYIDGFNQCVAINKYTAPTSYVSKAYSVSPGANANAWVRSMNALYKKDARQPPVVLMAWAGAQLTATWGAEKTVEPDQQSHYEAELSRLLSQRREHAKEKPGGAGVE